MQNISEIWLFHKLFPENWKTWNLNFQTPNWISIILFLIRERFRFAKGPWCNNRLGRLTCICVCALCTTTFQRRHLALPKEKYNFILIESFIVTINHDDLHIYSCLISSSNVVILEFRFGISVSINRYKYYIGNYQFL